MNCLSKGLAECLAHTEYSRNISGSVIEYKELKYSCKHPAINLPFVLLNDVFLQNAGL